MCFLTEGAEVKVGEYNAIADVLDLINNSIRFQGMSKPASFMYIYNRSIESNSLQHTHIHTSDTTNTQCRDSPLSFTTRNCALSQLNYLPVHFSPLLCLLVLTYFVICSIPLAILPFTALPLFLHLLGLAPHTETLGQCHLRCMFPHP